MLVLAHTIELEKMTEPVVNDNLPIAAKASSYLAGAKGKVSSVELLKERLQNMDIMSVTEHRDFGNTNGDQSRLC